MGDQTDELWEHTQELVTLVLNTTKSEIPVLDTLISGIVNATVEARQNGILGVNEAVYELTQIIQEVITAAATQGVDISECTTDSIARIQEYAKEKENNITNSLNGIAENGIQQLSYCTTELNNVLATVQTFSVTVQQCRLKEDVERAVCTAQLSVQLTKLEDEVTQNISSIEESSVTLYDAILKQLKTDPETVKWDFIIKYSHIVDEVINCANNILPTTLTTPSFPTVTSDTTFISTTLTSGTITTSEITSTPTASTPEPTTQSTISWTTLTTSSPDTISTVTPWETTFTTEPTAPPITTSTPSPVTTSTPSPITTSTPSPITTSSPSPGTKDVICIYHFKKEWKIYIKCK